MARQRTKNVSNAVAESADMSYSRSLETLESADSTAIGALAYQLWLARGCPEGSPEIDWFQAEQKLCSRPVKSKSLSTKRLLLTRQVSA